MSFFNAHFFSAFEKVVRVCALFLNALFACIYGQIPLSCTVYMILFCKCLFPSDAIKTAEVICHKEKHNA